MRLLPFLDNNNAVGLGPEASVLVTGRGTVEAMPQ